MEGKGVEPRGGKWLQSICFENWNSIQAGCARSSQHFPMFDWKLEGKNGESSVGRDYGD